MVMYGVRSRVYGRMTSLFARVAFLLSLLVGAAPCALRAGESVTTTAQHDEAKSNADLGERLRFNESFVSFYECHSSGKFTHEYHPFLLQKTAQSFRRLESFVSERGFSCAGRLILLGYEERGVPSYLPDSSVGVLTDEMSINTNAGWSLGMQNRFGMITGFLMKDSAALTAAARMQGSTPLPLTHVDAHELVVFDNLRTIFQQHAFGDAYELAMELYDQVCIAISANDTKRFFEKIGFLWQELYTRQCKLEGKQHVGGTQDVLFSLSYLSHISASSLPLLHMFTGPDITYPIEKTAAHSEHVTRHAQRSLRELVGELVPRNNKKTAYIFSSFVDGVGKSTTLGNLINWQRHGDDIASYEHVDNASSQLPTLYECAENVCVVDLPAQVSHFTYKPDGHVYADITACTSLVTPAAELVAYVAGEGAALTERFNKRIRAEKSLRGAREGAVPPASLRGEPKQSVLYSSSLTDHFIDNLFILKRVEQNRWVPFEYAGESYLFSLDRPSDIRWCCPIESAPSHGLKNIVPEQMIFDGGVKFPLAFESFLESLNTLLAQSGVEEVVFVDFLSMYSRSSRENIRVTYLLQQLHRLYDDYMFGETFYQNFVESEELLALLAEEEKRSRFVLQLEREALVRTALYEYLVTSAGTTTLESRSLAFLDDYLRTEIAHSLQTGGEYIHALVEKKIAETTDTLERLYGKSRTYLAYYRADVDELARFSTEVFVPFMSRFVSAKNVESLWERLDNQRVIVDGYSGGFVPAVLENGTPVTILGELTPGRFTKGTFQYITRYLRASWHVAASMLLFSTGRDASGRYECTELLPVIPCGLLPDENGRIYLVQLEYPQVDPTADNEKLYEFCEISDLDTRLFQDREGKTVLADFAEISTAFGMYGFAHAPRKEDGYQVHWSLVSGLIASYYAGAGAEEAIFPADLSLFARNSEAARVERALENVRVRARERGTTYPQPFALVERATFDEYGQEVKKQKVYWGTPSQSEGAAAWSYLMTELTMRCQDMSSDLLARRDNADDREAIRRLYEQSTLPCCWGITFAEPLSYDRVEGEIDQLARECVAA